jgi:hypothetical protein
MSIYSGQFTSRQDVEGNFRVELGDEIEIVFAHYSGYGHDDSDYEMWAHVLFWNKRQRQLFEVHGSHCSCYGLEGQWEPSEVNVKDILADIKMGKTWASDNRQEIDQRLIDALRALA